MFEAIKILNLFLGVFFVTLSNDRNRIYFYVVVRLDMYLLRLSRFTRISKSDNL